MIAPMPRLRLKKACPMALRIASPGRAPSLPKSGENM
jgi:hypothetical protein